ncbi:hypothetical protein DWG24_05210 [Dickeya zeae]|uniref:Uncharacterized protein n=1 Tax=Dickeya zeae TaxID=204042 RepID=A0AAE6YXB1_9GAMM|nr:hypothetical protein DWG24_05210 [Dickeya zeae]
MFDGIDVAHGYRLLNSHQDRYQRGTARVMLFAEYTVFIAFSTPIFITQKVTCADNPTQKQKNKKSKKSKNQDVNT